MTQDTFKTLREFTPAPGKTAKYHSLAALEAARTVDAGSATRSSPTISACRSLAPACARSAGPIMLMTMAWSSALNATK